MLDLQGDTLALGGGDQLTVFEHNAGSWSDPMIVPAEEGLPGGFITSVVFAGNHLVVSRARGVTNLFFPMGTGTGVELAVFEPDPGAASGWAKGASLLSGRSDLGLLRLAARGDRLAALAYPSSIFGAIGTHEYGRVELHVFEAGADGLTPVADHELAPFRAFLPLETGAYLTSFMNRAPAPSIAVGEILAGLPQSDSEGTADWVIRVFDEDNTSDGEPWSSADSIRGPGEPEALGQSLDMSGSFLAAGVPGDDSEGIDSGSVMVWFNESFGGTPVWRPLGRIVSPGAEGGGGFGSSVSIINKDTDRALLAVGAPFEDGERGKVYLFAIRADPLAVYADSTIEFLGEATSADSRSASDSFGWAVDLVQGTGTAIRLAVGCPGFDISGISNMGAVYLFDLPADDSATWVEIKRIVQPVVAKFFGSTLAQFSDTLVVGRSTSLEGGGQSGRVFLFEEDEGGTDIWGLDETLAAPSDAPEGFGSPVATDETLQTLAVGAPGRDTSGAVYIYSEKGTDTWSELLVANGGADGPSFGSSIAINRLRLVVGVPGHPSGGAYRLYDFPEDFAVAEALFGEGPELASWGLRHGAPRLAKPGETVLWGQAVAISEPHFAVSDPARGAGSVRPYRRSSYEFWAM